MKENRSLSVMLVEVAESKANAAKLMEALGIEVSADILYEVVQFDAFAIAGIGFKVLEDGAPIEEVFEAMTKEEYEDRKKALHQLLKKYGE